MELSGTEVGLAQQLDSNWSFNYLIAKNKVGDPHWFNSGC